MQEARGSCGFLLAIVFGLGCMIGIAYADEEIQSTMDANRESWNAGKQDVHDSTVVLDQGMQSEKQQAKADKQQMRAENKAARQDMKRQKQESRNQYRSTKQSFKKSSFR